VVVVCQITSNLTQATPFQFTVTERAVAVTATATNFNTNTNTLGCVTGNAGCMTVSPATPGDHQDIATVDPDNRVHESNEGNNNATATVTVYPYDLNVVVTDAPDPVVSTPACCELTYTVTITNGSAGAQTAFPFWVNGSLALRDPANGSGNIPGDVSSFAQIFSVSSSRGATDTCQFQPFASFGIQQYTCTMGSMAPGEVVTLTVLVDALAPETDGGFDVGIDANLMNLQRPLGGNTIGAQCQSSANAAGGTNPACSAEKAVNTGGATTYTNNPPTTISSNDRAIQTTDVD
jgi:hypothetical protein